MNKPLTLVAGYLGAGKTTLVNRLLESNTLKRVAIVVNDFGSVNIDARLIAKIGVDTIELTNGCVCCQISDDVQRTMGRLAIRSDIDRIIWEVSGVADPARLSTWFTYPGYFPGGVMVCVDAESTMKRLADGYVADVVAAQMRAADLLTITKSEVVSREQLSQVREKCTELAGVVPTFMTATPNGTEYVFDDFDSIVHAITAFGIDRGRRRDRGVTDRAELERRGTGEVSATAEVRQDAPGTHRSLAVAVPGPVDLDAVRDILDTHLDRLIRAKGVVESTCGEFKVVQLAGDRVRVVPAPIGMGRSLDPCMVLVAVGPEADEDLRRVAQDLRALCEG